MSSYEDSPKFKGIKSLMNPTWIDEVGLKLGLIRFKNEDMGDYQKRVLKHARNLPRSTQDGFINTLPRVIATNEYRVFKLSLVVEEETNIPLARDPRVEIDSTFLTIWSDYKALKDKPDLKIDLVNRDGAYFLRDVFSAINKLNFINIDIDDKKLDWKFLYSKNLKYCSSDGHESNYSLQNTKFNELPHKNINEFWLSSSMVFYKDKGEEYHYSNNSNGDYSIDKENGYLWSHTPAAGTITYTYRKFPFIMRWQPIRSFPINDKSLDHLTKDYLINPDGQNERLLLNGYGAEIANKILAIHPLQWGE